MLDERSCDQLTTSYCQRAPSQLTPRILAHPDAQTLVGNHLTELCSFYFVLGVGLGNSLLIPGNFLAEYTVKPSVNVVAQ